MQIDRPPSSLALLALALLLPAVARAADEHLPPTEAKPFTAVYHIERRYRLPPDKPEWVTLTDTVTISISGLQSRWDYKTDARTVIYDYGKRMLLDFGGKQPANTATRFHFTALPMPIGWEFGYGKAARVEGAKAQVTGKATVAGQECIRVLVESEEYGKPDFCVAQDGTVLRYENQGLNDGIVYEAASVTPGAIEAARFELPAGYSAQDRSAAPPGSRPLSFDKPGSMSPAPSGP